MGESSGKQSYISIEGGKMVRVERKKKKTTPCSKLSDDISVHCSRLDAAALLASAGLVLPWRLLASCDFERWRGARGQELTYLWR